MQLKWILLIAVLFDFSHLNAMQTQPSQLPTPQYQRDLYFNNITLADGLNQSSIYAIEKDQYGFSWLGTQDGLHRFDGHKAEVVKLGKTDIPHYRFIKTLKIINNILFIGTTDGLLTIELSTGTKHYFSELQFKINTIEKVNKQVWVGTENGIYIINPKNLKIHKQIKVKSSICDSSNRATKSLCTNDTRAILHKMTNNSVWIGTVNGLYTLNLATHIPKYIEVDYEKNQMLSSDDIRTLFLDNLEQIWVGTFDGLNMYSEKTKTFHRYNIAPTLSFSEMPPTTNISSNKIKAISQDKDGYLWVATTHGLNRSELPIISVDEKITQWHHFKHQNQTSNALLSNLIRSIYTDTEGRIWVGTNKGLSVTNIYRTQSKVIRSFSADSRLSYILSYKQDKQQNKWLGSRNGLTIITTHGQQIRIKGIENQPVYSIAFTEKHGWVGTKKGIFKINLNNLTVTKLLNSRNSPIDGRYIYSLLPSRHNILWVGTSYGLFKYNYLTEQWQYWNKEQGLVHHEIYSLKEINQSLWIGTSGGLSILDSNYNFINYQNKNSGLNSDWVFDITQDRFDKIWLATSGGVYHYQPKKQNFDYIGITEGNAYAILFDNQNSAWISSNKGIYKYNLTSKKIRQYRPSDGFSDLEYIDNSAYKNSSGILSFGGISGLTFFSPEKKSQFEQQLTFRISRVNINNQYISLWQKASTDKNTPLFLLNNLDIDWNIKKYQVFFNNPYFALSKAISTIGDQVTLNDGQLDLSYISSGNHDISLPYNTSDNYLSIYKAPHPMLSIWAFIIYLLLLVTFCYFIYRHHFLDKYAKSLNKKNLIIEQQQNELKQNLKSKKQLYFQIQHSMKSPISAQKGYLYQISKILKQDKPDRLSLNRKLKKLEQIQEYLTLMVEEILLLSKGDIIETFESINILSTIQSLEKTVETLALDKDLKIKYDIGKTIKQTSYISGPENGLFTILENLLTNAIKFSYSKTQITCSLNIKDSQLHISVQDFGIGIPETEINKILQPYYRATNTTDTLGSGIGLTVVINTLNAMKGEIKITSKVNEGSIISLFIPLSS